jgi:hypothetical protein
MDGFSRAEAGAKKQGQKRGVLRGKGRIGRVSAPRKLLVAPSTRSWGPQGSWSQARPGLPSGLPNSPVPDAGGHGALAASVGPRTSAPRPAPRALAWCPERPPGGSPIVPNQSEDPEPGPTSCGPSNLPVVPQGPL